MARKKIETMGSFAFRMSLVVFISVLTIGGLIFAFTYGPLSPNKSRASNFGFDKVDPQTGEYYDLQLTSHVETTSLPNAPKVYVAKTRFELGGERVSGYRQIFGFAQQKGSLDKPAITFEYTGANYPYFKSSDVDLLNNDCVDLHSSNVPSEKNYIGSFCYSNTYLYPNSGASRVYTPAANPFIEFNYTGSKPTTVQFLTTVFDKFKNPAPYNGLPVQKTRVHYLTIDAISSSTSDFKKVSYYIQGITHELTDEQYNQLCMMGEGLPKKYLKQSLNVIPQGGNNNEMLRAPSGGCSFMYTFDYLQPFFISLDMEGGVPLPKPSPIVTGPVPTIMLSYPPKEPTPYPKKTTPPPTKLPTRGPTPAQLPVAPTISTNSLITAIQGRKYTNTITAVDSNTDEKINMKITGLPTGISQGSCVMGKTSDQISITCQISGITSKVGAVKITVTATDTRGLSTSKALLLPIKSIRSITL